MLKHLADWLDVRTGYRAALNEALEEPIPGGARWKYVFGSALTSTFLTQAVTGLFLMLCYSPSATTAWGSVFFINEQMSFGWIIRGVHHFGSQAMVILLGLHLVQVLLAGAYRAPREVNWWFGLALLFVTLGFSLTGYLLPWDQKGYWATRVATNIMGGAPVLGPAIQKVVVGGSEYGNQTLTRFYALHVGLLPALLVACFAAHIALFRRHGVTAPANSKRPDGQFWPEQVFMDIIASVGILGVLLGLVVVNGGANLDAPADPSGEYPARPEWYFLSLFQMLKYFPGESEVLGTVVVPMALLAILVALPLLDKVLPRGLAHFLACAFVFAVAGGVAYLTFVAFNDDAKDAEYQKARVAADVARDRSLALARRGIPPDGAGYLLLRDPQTHGKAVLEAKCLGCHAYGGQRSGEGTLQAGDLKGFGTLAWVRGLLEDPDSDAFFGKLKGCDARLAGMSQWKKGVGKELTAKQLDEVAAFVASMAAVPADTPAAVWEASDAVQNHPGYAVFADQCAGCHLFGEADEANFGPSLYRWGSFEWFRRVVLHPDSPELYGVVEDSCRMPAFAEQLTENDLKTLHGYLRGDDPAARSSDSDQGPASGTPGIPPPADR